AITTVQMTGGPDASVWGTSADQAGIKHPLLTGMMKRGDVGLENFTIVQVANPNGGGNYVLQKLGVVAQADLNIDPSQLVGAGANDWVAFSVALGTVGRRHNQILTGPDGQGPIGSPALLSYMMSDLPGLTAGPLVVTLPLYQLPLPSH